MKSSPGFYPTLTLAACLSLRLICQADPVINVHLSTINIVGTILTNESVSLSPGWSGARYYGTNVYASRPVTQRTGLTGETIFSNVVFGPYGLDLTDTHLELEVPTNLTGTVDVGLLITNPAVILPVTSQYIPGGPNSVTTNGITGIGQVAISTNIFPFFFWGQLPAGGNGSGITALVGTTNAAPSVIGGVTGLVPTNYDAVGAGTNAAKAATNGYPWGPLYDPVNSAFNATNGYPWGPLYQPAGSYLTGNQTITLSKDVTGSGATSIAVTVTNLGDATPGQTLPAMSGVNLTALNGSQVTSGTIQGSRISTDSVTITNNGGANGTSLTVTPYVNTNNASTFTSGTVPGARLPTDSATITNIGPSGSLTVTPTVVTNAVFAASGTVPTVSANVLNIPTNNFGGGGGSVPANTTTNGNLMFNVMAYGATGNGATDDSAAISNAAVAMEAAGGGILYFPGGTNTYLCTTLNSKGIVLQGPPFKVLGVNGGSEDVGSLTQSNIQPCTAIEVNTASGSIFTISNCPAGTFEDIAFINTNRATSGDEVVIISTNPTPKICFNRCTFHGGWNQLHYCTGEGWAVTACGFYNFANYGMLIENDVNGDYGDWFIGDGCYFSCSNPGLHGNAAINILSSGGAKIEGVKINSYANLVDGQASISNGIVALPTSSTSNLQIIGCSIENLFNQAIYMNLGSGGWYNVNIVGNEFYNMKYGVSLQQQIGNNCAVIGNVFRSVTYPVNFYESSEVTMAGNTAQNGSGGIYQIFQPGSANVGYSYAQNIFDNLENGGITNVSSATSVTVPFTWYFPDTNYSVWATGDGAALSGVYTSGATVSNVVLNFSSFSGNIRWGAHRQASP